VGRLVGLTSRPLLGVRPVWNGPTPPAFDPNADCRTQAVPSLKADAGPAPVSHPVSRAVLSSAKVRRLVDRIKKESGR
jgi:hypothetical protein